MRIIQLSGCYDPKRTFQLHKKHVALKRRPSQQWLGLSRPSGPDRCGQCTGYCRARGAFLDANFLATGFLVTVFLVAAVFPWMPELASFGAAMAFASST